MQISLIYGGRSVEHAWSIEMYNHFVDVLNAQEAKGIDVVDIFYISQTSELRRLRAPRRPNLPDHSAFLAEANIYPLTHLPILLEATGHFVFSLLQGQDGEDGQIQAIAQFHSIAGSFGDKTAAVISADKRLQSILANHFCPDLTEIPTAYVHQDNRVADIAQALARMQGGCVLKPNTLGGSFLTLSVDNLSAERLADYADRIFAYDSAFLVQKRIVGVEHTCGVIVDGGTVHALPVARIENPSRFLGYEQKTRKGSYSVVFEDIPESLEQRLSAASVLLARQFGLHTLGRFDYTVDDQGRIYFFEVNIVPGLTAGSIYPKMLNRAGLTLGGLIAQAVRNDEHHRSRELRRKKATSLVSYGAPLSNAA